MSAEVRVSRAALGRGAALRAGIVVPLVAASAVSLRSGEAPGQVATVVIVAVGVIVGVVAVAGLVTAVRADADGVWTRRLVGLERHLPADHLARAVLVTGYEQYASPLTPKLILLGRDGQRLLNLPGHGFEVVALTRLLRAMPCEQMLLDEILTPALLQERVVGAVPWWERHPFGLAFVVVGAVVVLVVAGAVLTGG